MLIGEVAERTGISARMLRHYDRLGLLSPSGRTAGGYREYASADLTRLFHIEALRSLGLSLEQIRDTLADLAFSPAALVEQLRGRTRERLAHEQDLLRRLDRVQAGQPAAWSDVLRLVGLLRGLEAPDPATRQRSALALEPRADDAGSLAEAALSEREVNVAGTLDWALARSGEGALPPLVAALDSDDGERRRRAVSAIEKLATPAALGALADAADHPDPWVRHRAALAAAAAGRPAAIPALVAMVVGGVQDVDAADALAVLGSSGWAAEIGTVMAAAAAQATPAARRRLAGALADIPGAAAAGALTALAADPEPGVALTARSVLTNRGR